MRNIQRVFQNISCYLGILRKISCVFNRIRARYIILNVISAFMLTTFLCGCNKEKPQIPFANSPGYISDVSGVKIAMLNANEAQMSVDNFKDNVLVAVFSTTWCPNCPAAVKSLEKLDAALKSEGINNVKIIIVNLGNADFNEIKSHYAGNLDVYACNEQESKLDCVKGVPACIVFDKSGKAVYGFLGANDFSAEPFKKYIKCLSKE